MFRQEYFLVFVKEAAPMPLFLTLFGKTTLQLTLPALRQLGPVTRSLVTEDGLP
jgi:hypothetical protein